MIDFSTGTERWIVLGVLIAVLLTIDLLVVRGRGGEMSTRQAAIASIVWVAISVAFGLLLFASGAAEDGGNFLAGYVVEKSLSLDNVFVFLLVLNAFAVEQARRHQLLTYGILLALVMRGFFIVVGAAALSAFGWVNFLFAALLAYTAWKLFKERHSSEGEEELVEGLQQKLPIAREAHPGWVAREGGKRVLTTAGAALVLLAIVDIIFAIDSVPAILAITDDAYIVFAANAFALLGLRPLFFLVADLVERLYYLKTALAALLLFIAAKMVLAELVGKIGPEISLPVIALILGTGTVASLVRDKRIKREEAEAASAPKPPIAA